MPRRDERRYGRFVLWAAFSLLLMATGLNACANASQQIGQSETCGESGDCQTQNELPQQADTLDAEACVPSWGSGSLTSPVLTEAGIQRDVPPSERMEALTRLYGELEARSRTLFHEEDASMIERRAFFRELVDNAVPVLLVVDSRFALTSDITLLAIHDLAESEDSSADSVRSAWIERGPPAELRSAQLAACIASLGSD